MSKTTDWHSKPAPPNATPAAAEGAMGLRKLHIDLFCRVVDNFGDMGVCWRLACDLARRGHGLRLWTDDASALVWMAPGGHPGVQVLPWADAHRARAGDVVIEAFGCEIDANFVATKSMNPATDDQNHPKNPVWINLEYLSAESYVERCHALPSPVLSGPAAGMIKWFFYPGFNANTGGLIREPGLLERRAAFDADAWLARHGLAPRQAGEVLVSLFCYEPAAMAAWLGDMARGSAWHVDSGSPLRTRLLVTPGRAAAAVHGVLAQLPNCLNLDEISHLSWYSLGSLLSICYLPNLPQSEFDHLLWACDFNCVRGEDSWVRAIWAGKPLLWQLYEQGDLAHHAKLQAWLDAMNAPTEVRHAHGVWNAAGAATQMPTINVPAWQTWASQSRAQLSHLPSLTDQLLAFVVGKNPNLLQKAQ